MNETTTTKTKTSSNSRTQEQSSVSTETSKLALISISAFGAIIGTWSLIALVSAMVKSGGPLQLIGNWFRAVAGL